MTCTCNAPRHVRFDAVGGATNPINLADVHKEPPMNHDHDLKKFALHALREHNDKELCDWLEAGAPGALPYDGDRERVVQVINAIGRWDRESEGHPVPRFDSYESDNEWNLRGRLLMTMNLATRDSLLRKMHAERKDAASAVRHNAPASDDDLEQAVDMLRRLDNETIEQYTRRVEYQAHVLASQRDRAARPTPLTQPREDSDHDKHEKDGWKRTLRGENDGPGHMSTANKDK